MLGAVPFVGRTEEVRAFQETCVDVGEAPFATIKARHYDNVHGPDGIGKSALAGHLRGLVHGADRVAGVLVALDELDVVDVFQCLAQLRRDLGRVAPDLECPRFEAAYSLYLGRFRPRDFGTSRSLVGPVDPEEVFKKAVENGSKEGIKEVVAHLSAGALVGATPGLIASAMTTALIGAGVGVGGYLTVLLAMNYVIGLRAKIRSDAVLSGSARLRLLVRGLDRAKVADFRRDLPLLLAEDLNAALASEPRTLALLIDPVDALDDVTDRRAEPFAECLIRLVASLEQGYVLTFGRTPPLRWESQFQTLSARGTLPELYTCRRYRLRGVKEQDIEEAVDLHSSDMDAATIRPMLDALPRLPDGTISPTTLAAQWTAVVRS